MRYQYSWVMVVLLLVVARPGVFAGDKTNSTPNISILSEEDGVLLIGVTNTTDNAVLVNLERFQGVIVFTY